ncbi:MAG TPA: NUDIX domain-containing protein [Actinophytocola sp.]|nr:NUDIX domain-containing protein [Actinophytocola sp.]
MTALVDAPLRAVSAALTERALFGGVGVLAPGGEVRVLGGRLRVAEVAVSGLRLVPVGSVPVGVVPFDEAWYRTISRGVVPSGLVPSGLVPSGAVPSGAVPSGVVPSGLVPGGLSVRLCPVPGGVLVTCSAGFRWAMVTRRRVLGVLESLVDRVCGRAVALADASVVVGAAILRGRTVLAQQRAYPVDAAGRWELPGGRVEPAESDVDAVVRECAEELGVAVRAGEVVGPDVALSGRKVLRIYRAELVDVRAEPHPHDHQALRWLIAGRLGQVDWLPADRVLLPALRQLLRAPPR